MAEQNVTYPKISITAWWELRKKAQENPDMAFTPKNISNVLNLTITTVYANVYPALRQFELFDKFGNLTERGRKWLNDDEYKEVCTDILESIYPVELLNLVDDPVAHRDAVKDWFAAKANGNANAILQMTATFLMLWKGELQDGREKKSSKKTESDDSGHEDESSAAESYSAEQTQTGSATTVRTPRKYTRRNLPEPAAHPASQTQIETSAPPASPSASLEAKVKPSININVQLTITNETPVEQIDRLFSSMAKYLLVK